MSWQNWSGTESATPEQVLTPSSAEELASSVKSLAEQGKRLKAAGSGHSFTGCAAPEQVQVRLDGLSSIVSADKASGRVTVGAGTGLRKLNAGLAAAGLAMANLGDIDKQTISGAVATGTHGTGAGLGGLATQITGLDLVTADGSVLTCSDDELLSNRVFELTNRLTAIRPAITPQVNRLAAKALSAREYVDASYKVFCSNRDVRFRESEYAVPREHVVGVIRELRDWIERSGEHLPFPIEVRVAAADDVWLSTAYQRETAYVAIHQYHRLDHRRYFDAFEQIAASVRGRPHWGKMHTLDADRFGALYPRFDDFLAVRDRLDPRRVFANAYTRQVFGD